MRTEGETDLRTDMTGLVVAFRNFENAPNNGRLWIAFYSLHSALIQDSDCITACGIHLIGFFNGYSYI